ncbi:prohibitin family protein [Terasakiella sp.]|uniref:prohibitin family protein n=1 Tax=Terasakiella sp. TaxID=2034861 RepID=UPI003AA99419
MASVRKFIRRHFMWLSLSALLCLFTLVLLSEKIFISIPAGHAGVLWKRFNGGTDVKTTYPEGFHVILPWNEMTIYSVRLNEATSTFNVLAKDGLKIDVEFLVRYRPKEDQLGFLHKHMGEKYLDILILPEVSAKGRTVMAKYSPEEIYSTKRFEIQEIVEKEVKEELKVVLTKDDGNKDLIFLEDVLIKSIHLPQTVRLAIEAKVEHKHRMLQYEYILQREQQESKRKAIEASGIRKFQDIIKDGISPRYLKWKGIDATLELARSNNAKIVIIGAGDEGMPLILGNMDSNSAAIDPDAKKEEEWQRKLTSEKPDSIGQLDEPGTTRTTQSDKTFAQKALEKLSIKDLLNEDEKTDEKPSPPDKPATKP